MPRQRVSRNSTAAHRPCGFALTKFRPTTLPSTLITRSRLHDQLTSGAGKRLTVVVGSAGSGKSVLLSNWAATRRPGVTSWLSCDKADTDPVRFWSGFIEALQAEAPGFGAEAADVLALDSAMSADVTASLANDAMKLPEGMAIIVDDFHAATAVSADMTDLVERWPVETAQLVLAGRNDPPVRLHRLRLAGELCELRDDNLSLSLPETGDLLANFGVEMAAADLALLHERSEGWAAAVQMAALSLRATDDPARILRALDVRSHLISEYFVAEVLDQQPPEVARFLLDTSVLCELTGGSCAAVSERQDSAALLRHIDAANLFLVPLDDERTIFRYHHLVRQVLRAELRARDSARERALQLRAGAWCEAAGDTRRATRHFLAARQTDRALALLQDRVVPDFLRDPIAPSPLDMSMVDPALLADAPERMLGLAADLLLSGDVLRGAACLDAIECTQPAIPPGSRLAARFALMRAFQYGQTGRLTEAVTAAHTARGIHEQMHLSDEWCVGIPLILLRVYPCLDDFPAVEHEAEAALALPGLPEPARLILVPSARALARFLAGHLTEAARAARTAEQEARRLGFDRHFFAVDYRRVLAGLALERRDLSTAERLGEQTITITEAGRPIFEFLTLLDRARIWTARGKIREALTTVAAARRVLAEPSGALQAQADELEAKVRLVLGDAQVAAELARGVPAARRDLLLARIALAAGDHQAAQEHLQRSALGSLTPRNRLVRQILLAAAAIERSDPTADGIVGGAVQRARQEGFIDTLVSTAPQVTGYLIEHAARMRSDPYLEQVINAALDVRASLPDRDEYRQLIAEPLTAAELRILKLLPTSTYLQIAATLYISRNTVKTQLRSVYQKLGATSRSEAIERAVDLRLL
ncbi:MAG TPA: LuxR C-terminal-related transcriptional regulator [Trebonia sp.]|nr:LuxR C-terminal-related transcriptional regulator [Trebonia sp.]